MSLFSRDTRIGNRVELISLHIPKTAGTSFRNSLKSIYGDSGAVRLDINPIHRWIKVEERKLETKKLPNEVKVIHGHFHLDHLYEDINLKASVPVITWMRDPVKRVISNYHYLAKRLREELQEEKKDLNILAKMERNLIEYARADVNRNVQSRYIAQKPLSEFAFVGIVEDYSIELQRMSELFDWKDIPEHQQNKTGYVQPSIPNEWLEEIKDLNQKDCALYTEALNLQKQRVQ